VITNTVVRNLDRRRAWHNNKQLLDFHLLFPCTAIFACVIARHIFNGVTEVAVQSAAYPHQNIDVRVTTVRWSQQDADAYVRYPAKFALPYLLVNQKFEQFVIADVHSEPSPL